MREHPLDGEMRLARIGGSQHCRYTGTAGSRCSGRLRRKTDSHYASELVLAAATAASTPLFLYHNATTSIRLIKL
jgi:hypothetical protein